MPRLALLGPSLRAAPLGRAGNDGTIAYTSTLARRSLDNIYEGALLKGRPQPQPQRVPRGTQTTQFGRHASMNVSKRSCLEGVRNLFLSPGSSTKQRLAPYIPGCIYEGLLLEARPHPQARRVPLGTPTTQYNARWPQNALPDPTRPWASVIARPWALMRTRPWAVLS